MEEGEKPTACCDASKPNKFDQRSEQSSIVYLERASSATSPARPASWSETRIKDHQHQPDRGQLVGADSLLHRRCLSLKYTCSIGTCPRSSEVPSGIPAPLAGVEGRQQLQKNGPTSIKDDEVNRSSKVI